MYIEYRISTPEFEKKYKELVRRRADVQKAHESYGSKMQERRDSCARYQQVHNRLLDFKDILEEVRVARCDVMMYVCMVFCVKSIY